MEKLRQEELRRQREARLINRIQTLVGWLLFRAVGVRSALGVRFRIKWHEREAMLADIDNMFS